MRSPRRLPPWRSLFFGAHLWQQIAEPARELADLQARIREAQSQAELYKDVTAQAAAVDRWLATDVVWLDELEQFARRVRPQPLSAKDFHVANDAVITQLIMSKPPGNKAVGGRVDVQAVAKSPAAVAALEQRLRDATHTVSTGIGKLDKSFPGYDWSFGLEMRVLPPPTNPWRRPRNEPTRENPGRRRAGDGCALGRQRIVRTLPERARCSPHGGDRCENATGGSERDAGHGPLSRQQDGRLAGALVACRSREGTDASTKPGCSPRPKRPAWR